MQKEVKYAGYTAVPDDYNSNDGELSASLNLIPEDGSMRVVQPPKKVMQCPDDFFVIYIHKSVNRYEHYIVYDKMDERIHWGVNDNGVLGTTAVIYDFGVNETLCDISALGNVLVLLTSKQRVFLYCRNTDNGYTYVNLGNKVPSVKLQFALDLDFYDGEVRHESDKGYSVYPPNEYFNERTYSNEENLSKASTAVHGVMNKFIADKTEAGYFIFPFFVRYAIRLFDGSLISHSEPIFIAPCNRAMPALSVQTYISVQAVLGKLKYKAVDFSNLSEWGDIIRSIDIFVSAPIYTYDINEDVIPYSSLPTGIIENRFTIGRNKYQEYTADGENRGSEISINDHYFQIYDAAGEVAGDYLPGLHWNTNGGNYLKYFDKKVMETKIKSVSDFYYLTSIDVKDLSTTFVDVDIENGHLSTLVNREVMSDDYNSNDDLQAQIAYAYNGRMNLANIETILHNPLPYECSNLYSNGQKTYRQLDEIFGDESESGTTEDHEYSQSGMIIWQTPTETNKYSRFKVWIYIENNGGDEVVVTGDESLHTCTGTFPYYIFYPNVNAKKAIIRVKDYESGQLVRTTYYKAPMQQHVKLNGAVFFGGMELDLTKISGLEVITSNYPDEAPTDAAKRHTMLHNRIYTSEVNNPFYYPVTNMNSVGSEEVRALNSAAKALSEGQFGEFPLYAFCTDGVWSLSVSQTGGFVAKQPITRDVLIDKASMCQLDGSVLFGTARGVMELQGSQSLCLTEALDTPNVFSPLSLQGTSALIQHADSNNWLDTFTDDELQIRAFRDFISHCRMAYDYNNQRVLFFNPDYDSDQNKYKFQYAYIYSITEKAWGMTTSILHSTVNSYPEALAMGHDNALYNLSVPDPARQYERIPAYILTRPLKLDYPDVLKTIDTIIQRGVFSDAIIRQALYASRDMQHWHLVWSSGDRYLRGFRGTPYKYYRLAVFLQMRKTDSINGITVQFQPRLTNQPR